jgi:uncharacterized membrane protein YbhN (UPF0104 family)
MKPDVPNGPGAGWQRWLRALPPLLGVLLLLGAVYVVQKEFRHLRLDDIEAAMQRIPHRSLAIAFGITIAAYLVLTMYDLLGSIYAEHRLPYRRIAFASFCAYALSHNLGFSALSGGAVRFRLYAGWGYSPLQIGKLVAFGSLTFTLGGLVIGGAALLFEPRALPFIGTHLPVVAAWHRGGAMESGRGLFRPKRAPGLHDGVWPSVAIATPADGRAPGHRRHH